MLDDAIVREIGRLSEAGTPFCLASIVDGGGSIPQIVGASALFGMDGLAYGTVGGGRLEEMCRATARELLTHPAGPKTVFRKCNLQKDLGMTCGGWVALYFEVHRLDLEWNVAIFGAGHVAQVLCRFLLELDCRTTCIDTRDEWLGRLPANARLQARRVAHYADGVEWIVPGSDVIVMTMGHHSDLPVLKAIHERQPPIAQLGVIGSDGKAAMLRRELLQAGISRDFVDRIVCPLGDKLGNNTPAEIAVGIVSQLLRQRRRAAS